jgi:hypothetical protein
VEEHPPLESTHLDSTLVDLEQGFSDQDNTVIAPLSKGILKDAGMQSGTPTQPNVETTFTINQNPNQQHALSLNVTRNLQVAKETLESTDEYDTEEEETLPSSDVKDSYKNRGPVQVKSLMSKQTRLS